jgi:hypothetical protein
MYKRWSQSTSGVQDEAYVLNVSCCILQSAINTLPAMDSKDSVEITEKVDTSRDGVAIDDSARKAERKLRTKIDFFVVPTVTLLYLMCFIDRTNIG